MTKLWKFLKGEKGQMSGLNLFFIALACLVFVILVVYLINNT